MRKILLTILLGLSLTASSQVALAGGPSANFSVAADHSLRGGAYASGASAQAIAATVALPFVLIGETAKVSTQAGEALLDFATTPLDIAEESPSVRQLSSDAAKNVHGTMPPPNRALLEQ